MKAPHPILAVVLLLVAGVSGHWLGQERTADAAVETDTSPVAKSDVAEAPVNPAGPEEERITRLEQASAADMAGIWAETWAEFGAVRPTDGTQAKLRRDTFELVILRWAELDPVAALAFFSAPEQAEAEKQVNGRATIIAAWAEQDVAAAAAAALAIPAKPKEPGTYRRDPVDGAGWKLLSGDPKIFWEWFKLCRKPLPRASVNFSPAWLEIARNHPEELLAIAGELAVAPSDKTPRPRWMSEPKWVGIYALLGRIKAASDPRATLEWAKELPQEARNSVIKEALELLVKDEPKFAWSQLKEMKAAQGEHGTSYNFNANELGKKIIEELGARDPRDMLQWLKDENVLNFRSGVDVNSAQLATILSEAMKTGKMTSAEVFAGLRGSKDDGAFVRLNVLPRLYRGLPVEMLRQVGEELLASDSKSSKPFALAGLVTSWMDEDPAGAQKFLSTITNRDDRVVVAQHLARDFSHRTDPANPITTEEITTLLPADVRAAAIADQLRLYYADNMADHFQFPPSIIAMAAALEDVPAGKDKQNAMSRIASTWGVYDPRESTLWAVQLPDEESRRTALIATGDAWAKQDEFGLSQWLESQPESLQRDIGAHRLARSLRTSEPDSAWLWAGSITDASERAEAQAAVLRKWGKSSPGEALAAAESAWTEDATIQSKLREALDNANK